MLINNKTIFLIFSVVLGIFLFFIGANIGSVYRLTDGDMFIKLSYISEDLYISALKFHLPYALKDILWGLTAVFCWALFVLYTMFSRNNFRPGEEHGSARWGTKDDIRDLVDKNKYNNMIFTQTEQISLNTRQTMRSNNFIVIGGTGTGKTRFVIKPNIMQMHCSYVVTDPKSSVLDDVGNMLLANGYDIRTFNTVDFSKSMHYNPFGFIKTEADIKIFVDMFMANTRGKGEKSSDPFWDNAERLVYMALISFIVSFLPKEEQSFAMLNRMINNMEVKEDDEDYMNIVDHIFAEVELGTEKYMEKYGNKDTTKNADKISLAPQPNHFCVTQYKKFKLAAGVIKYR